MLLFIAQHQVWIAPGPAGIDPMGKVAQVEDIIDDLLAGTIDLETWLQTNQVLKPFSQIEWWGRTGQTCDWTAV